MHFSYGPYNSFQLSTALACAQLQPCTSSALALHTYHICTHHRTYTHTTPIISTPCKHSFNSSREAIMDAPLRKIFVCSRKNPSGTSDYSEESSLRETIEMVVMGNLFVIKLLQFSM